MIVFQSQQISQFICCSMTFKVFLTIAIFSFIGYSSLIIIPLHKYPSNWNLTVLVHLQNIGDVTGQEGQWVGTKGQARRLEGFSINVIWPDNFPHYKPKLSYMAHIQNIGDVDYVNEGEFVGTRGKSLRLQGFAIKLTGLAAEFFQVRYKAHLEDKGDTQFFADGEFCGSKGEGKRVESIYVNVIKKRLPWRALTQRSD